MKKVIFLLFPFLFFFLSCNYKVAYKCKDKLNETYYQNCSQKVLKKCKNPSVIKNALYCEVN